MIGDKKKIQNGSQNLLKKITLKYQFFCRIASHIGTNTYKYYLYFGQNYCSIKKLYNGSHIHIHSSSSKMGVKFGNETSMKNYFFPVLNCKAVGLWYTTCANKGSSMRLHEVADKIFGTFSQVTAIK